MTDLCFCYFSISVQLIPGDMLAMHVNRGGPSWVQEALSRVALVCPLAKFSRAGDETLVLNMDASVF